MNLYNRWTIVSIIQRTFESWWKLIRVCMGVFPNSHALVKREYQSWLISWRSNMQQKLNLPQNFTQIKMIRIDESVLIANAQEHLLQSSGQCYVSHQHILATIMRATATHSFLGIQILVQHYHCKNTTYLVH